MALTTSRLNSSPSTDLHVKPYAERHVKVYADSKIDNGIVAVTSRSQITLALSLGWRRSQASIRWAYGSILRGPGPRLAGAGGAVGASVER